VAGAGGEEAALASAQHDLGLARVGAVADARHELAGAGQHRGELVGRELEVLERDALDGADGAGGGDGGEVEERRAREQGVVGHGVSFGAGCRVALRVLPDRRDAVAAMPRIAIGGRR
jgi:hypothetical protein